MLLFPYLGADLGSAPPIFIQLSALPHVTDRTNNDVKMRVERKRYSSSRSAYAGGIHGGTVERSAREEGECVSEMRFVTARQVSHQKVAEVRESWPLRGLVKKSALDPT